MSETTYTFDGIDYRTRVVTDGVRYRPQWWGWRWSWWRPLGWVRGWRAVTRWGKDCKWDVVCNTLEEAWRAARDFVADVHREARAKRVGYRPVRSVLRPAELSADAPVGVVADWLAERGREEDADALRNGTGHLVHPNPKTVSFDLRTNTGVAH